MTRSEDRMGIVVSSVVVGNVVCCVCVCAARAFMDAAHSWMDEDVQRMPCDAT